MHKPLKVALLVETARGFGRDLLRGIARYSQHHGPWSFHIAPGDFEHDLPETKYWRGTGIIARIPNERIAQAILAAGLPTIAIGLTDEQKRPGSPLSKFSELSSDAREVARMAADHLLERRFSHFAYVGMEERCWSCRRENAYRTYLEQLGFDVAVYHQPRRVADCGWESERDVLSRWLGRLPTPVGLFACNDDRGRQVLEACRVCKLSVPGDVAVIGVDNDEVFCELADPPLSSIALNAETAGYRAAELLEKLMRGRVSKPRHVPVEALGVVARHSTDGIAVKDDDVAAAVKIIRHKHGCDVSVDSIADAVAVSRRSLERRFREIIGRSILEEIQLSRVEHAKRLLFETNYPISKIAKIVGCGSTGYFVTFFHQRVGQTPRSFRLALST
jgi:LacI family transcriptional regulator, galactose operon repressor